MTRQKPITRKEAEGWRLADIELKEIIGRGSFGTVRLVRHVESHKVCALKIMKKQEIIRQKQVEHILAEASLLQEIEHPFIVNFLYGLMDQDHLYLLLEYAAGGELFFHLRKAGRFPTNVAKFYCAQVVLAIEYLHSKNIIYRDLKPENLVLDADCNVKITDFGFAKRVTDRTFTFCGTAEYLAPEIILRKGHDKAADWWALGILLHEFLIGYPPFFDESPYKVYEKIVDGYIEFPLWVDKHAKDLIRGLLAVDKSRRLGSLKRGVEDIKRHQFFVGVDWNALLAKKIPPPISLSLDGTGDTRYFERYNDSPIHTLRPLSSEEQDAFANFCNGEYTRE